MFRVHLISDLDLKFNEFTPETELNIPDVELVILNGNLATVPKRGMLYVEQLCKKYPDIQFVYNYGVYERFPIGVFPKSKYGSEPLNALKTRSEFNESWPQNLHCFPGTYKRIVLRNGHKADIYCAFGFPKILSYEGSWESTYWYKNILAMCTNDINDPNITLPANTSRVMHGDLPIWATPNWLNEQNSIEFQDVRKWELNYDKDSGYKILVQHINPVTDTRYKGQKVDFYDIHLDKGLWLGSNTLVKNTMYLGAKFYSNPGRGTDARSLVLTTQRI